jgi:chloramphenicol 3-O-phosphotransferase
MSRAIILTGAPGAGKSSVLGKLSTLLEIDRVGFAAIESEEFGRGWPWLPQDQVMQQLAAVIALQRDAGRETFVVVATTETERELEAVQRAVAADEVFVVCLSAPPEIVAQRVANREPDAWPGKEPLIEHARQLAEQIPQIAGIDLSLSTVDRGPNEVAVELRDVLLSRGVLQRAG